MTGVSASWESLQGRPTGVSTRSRGAGEAAESGHTTSPGGEPSNAAARLLTVLLAFLPDGRPKGVTAVARRTGLSKTTVHRLLGTLVEFGFIERDTELYKPGRILGQLGALIPPVPAFTADRAAVLPVIRRLAIQTNAQAGYFELSGTSPRLLVSHPPSAPVPGLSEGVSKPLYDSPQGKVLLAFAREGVRKAAFITLHSAHSPVSRSEAALRAELARVRSDGIAVEHGTGGAPSVLAVPVQGCDGAWAGAISLWSHQPWAALSRTVPTLVRAATAATAAIAATSSGRPPSGRAIGPSPVSLTGGR